MNNTVEIVFADGFDPDDKPPTWKYTFRGLKYGEHVSIYIGEAGKIHNVNTFGILNNVTIEILEGPDTEED